jgi:LPXTG-site transpeptidase (sortase) family protein
VDAAIEPIGLTPEGAMDTPKGPEGVAWYKLGPRPGEIGSAVIAGHVGWKDKTQAVFDTLPSLRPGDKLSIENDTGTIITFVVRELRMYDQNQDASDVFNSFDEKAHLNLIGCEGVWDAVAKKYSKRLVVFTDRE